MTDTCNDTHNATPVAVAQLLCTRAAIDGIFEVGEVYSAYWDAKEEVYRAYDADGDYLWHLPLQGTFWDFEVLTSATESAAVDASAEAYPVRLLCTYSAEADDDPAVCFVAGRYYPAVECVEGYKVLDEDGCALYPIPLSGGLWQFSVAS